MSTQKIEFTLPADLGLSALLRRISEAIFLHAGFSEEWTERLKLVVDELFMNASRYGSASKTSRVYVVYLIEFDRVIFMIEDEGKEGARVDAEDLRGRIRKNSEEIQDLTKTSGRGLALISNFWTDGIQIHDSKHGGLSVSFTKKISKGKPPTLF